MRASGRSTLLTTRITGQLRFERLAQHEAASAGAGLRSRRRAAARRRPSRAPARPRRRLQEHRQRHDFQLRDQGAQVDAVPVQLHAARCFAAQFIQQLGIEHVAIQPQVEVHDVVQHAAGPIDFMDHPVLVDQTLPHRECAPLVGAGGLIANHLEMVGARIECEP